MQIAVLHVCYMQNGNLHTFITNLFLSVGRGAKMLRFNDKINKNISLML